MRSIAFIALAALSMSSVTLLPGLAQAQTTLADLQQGSGPVVRVPSGSISPDMLNFSEHPTSAPNMPVNTAPRSFSNERGTATERTYGGGHPVPFGVVRPPAIRRARANESWECMIVSRTEQMACIFYEKGTDTQVAGEHYYYYTLDGRPIVDEVRRQQAAAPSWQQAQAPNPNRDGMPRDAKYYHAVEPTQSGGVVEYGHDASPSLLQWFGLGLLAAVAGHNDGYYGRGFEPPPYGGSRGGCDRITGRCP
ncbi:MAG: hypothetical protein JWO84_344 [Parcubacteria group bacterium]|nr:hypothetical protein [Parcubacteria group bacterium]